MSRASDDEPCTGHVLCPSGCQNRTQSNSCITRKQVHELTKDSVCLQDLPAEWIPYLACGPTPAAVPCLVSLLGSPERQAAIYAASRCLLNLLRAPANASSIVQALVQVTNAGSPFAREQVRMCVWGFELRTLLHLWGLGRNGVSAGLTICRF